MADRTVNMNGENGKGKHTIDSERCDIVETPTGIGNGVYYACGKCGTALDVWARDQDVRDTISDALEKSVIDPLGLLAGLMANVKEESDNEAGLDSVVKLFLPTMRCT